MKKNTSALGQNSFWSTTPVSIASNTTTRLAPFNMLHFDNVSLQLHTTGATLAGTWTIEASNDFQNAGEFNELAAAGNWGDITALFDSIAAVTAGAPTVRFTQSIRPIAYKWIRAVFTNTAGTGTILGYPSAKGAQ